VTDLSVVGWVVANLAMVAGAAVQGAVGIGFALVAVPVLVLIDPDLVPAPFIVGGMVLSLLVARRERAHARWDEVGWASAGRFAGAVVGAAIVATLTIDQRGVVVGAAVLVGVAASLAGASLPVTPPALVGAGSVSGVMGTVAGLDGPPMALIYQHHPGPHVRANMARFFIIGSLQSALTLAVVGVFGWDAMTAGLLLVPGTVLGYLLSRLLVGRVDRGWTRRAILLVSAAGGTAVLAKALL
jgi:uncharacterized protein